MMKCCDTNWSIQSRRLFPRLSGGSKKLRQNFFPSNNANVLPRRNIKTLSITAIVWEEGASRGESGRKVSHNRDFMKKLFSFSFNFLTRFGFAFACSSLTHSLCRFSLFFWGFNLFVDIKTKSFLLALSRGLLQKQLRNKM